MKTTVRAVIRKGDRYLLVQRTSKDTAGGLWQFPGGNTDGQNPSKALKREIKEETNLTIK